MKGLKGSCASCACYQKMDLAQGECHRFPPVGAPIGAGPMGNIAFAFSFPMVQAVQVCGEYRKATADEPAS